MSRLEQHTQPTVPEIHCFAPLPTDLGVTFLERHLTYTGQLEEYISRYKRRPADIKHWPYGPYWPKHFDGFLLNTPRHKWTDAPPDEDDRLLFGDLGKEFNASCKTVDNQVTPYKGKWRGIQVTFDSERSPRDFSALPVPEGCCPSLAFESRFECGNLRQARRIGQFEYELVLKSDLYTARHTQWYYFRVSNVVPGITYKFRIVNLLKRDSLYNHGMRPLVYSEKEAAENKKGWHRTGHHISYTRNITNHNCPLLQRGVSYFMLEWQMEFPHADDTYYLAHCYPYSFTDLKEDLEVMMNSEERAKVTRREVMCETRAGNSCFLLTVSNFSVQETKKAVVITARVHPGESQASWMMKGLLEFITGPDKLAQELRNNFVFKIVPMINPDGVIVGNYRCSLSARDLNRNYRHPRRENFPTVWYLKNMMEDLARKYEIALYCDLHGHSRKPNMFMYGNNTSTEGEASALGMARAFISERLFPWLMYERSPDKFAFTSCKFSIRRCKESTGRVVMWRQMGVFNSFTLEATFSGTVLDKDNCRHFNILDFMSMGKTLAQTVSDYAKVQEDPTQQAQTVLDLTRVITEQILVSKGLIEAGAKLPDFGIGKDVVESDTEKVKESAEKWTGALLQLLNAPHYKKDTTEQQTSSSQSLAGSKPATTTSTLDSNNQTAATTKTTTGGYNNAAAQSAGNSGSCLPPTADTTSDGLVRPVYTKEDVVAMLGRMTGRGSRSMEDCLGILAQLDPHENLDESDSSDSDSESEPEMRPPEPKARKKKRKSKKHRDGDKKGDKKHGDDSRHKASSALPSLSALQRQGGSHSANSDNIHMGKSGKQAVSEKGGSHGSSSLGHASLKQMSGYISKYEGRHNGGVPCFTEERSMERAAKRMAELRKKHENDPHNRDVAFYCVDDNGVHTLSQEELNQRLMDLAAASSSNPATPLMGFNVKTGYTHATAAASAKGLNPNHPFVMFYNLQDLTPSPHQQPLNNVGTFLMTSSNGGHAQKHFAFQEIADQSSSDESESDCCSSVNDNSSLLTNNNNDSPGNRFNNNGRTRLVNNDEKTPIKNAFSSSSSSSSNNNNKNNGPGGPPSKKHGAFSFPITSKKNPYQQLLLDPLEDSSSSSSPARGKQPPTSSLTLSIQSHPLDSKINGFNTNFNSHHKQPSSSSSAENTTTNSNSILTVPANYIKTNLLNNAHAQQTSQIIIKPTTNHSFAANSGSSSTSNSATGNGNGNTTMSTLSTSAAVTPRRKLPDTKSSQHFNTTHNNNPITNSNRHKKYKSDLDLRPKPSSLSHDFNFANLKTDLKRSKTFYHPADSISSFSKAGGGIGQSSLEIPSNQSIYSSVILGKSDLKVDVLNGAKRSSATNGHHHQHHQHHHYHKTGRRHQVQNVEKLVQQLSENLMGVAPPIIPTTTTTTTKRMLHHNNRSSPLTLTHTHPSRSSRHAMSNATSPFMTSSGVTPTNRMVALPDCLSPRVDDKTRIGGGGGGAGGGRVHSGVVRTHRPSPSHQQEYFWE